MELREKVIWGWYNIDMTTSGQQNYTLPREEITRANKTRGEIPEILLKHPSSIPLNPSPKISVIIIGFNNGPYLKDTLHSILNQSYRDFECIVIDGGSTDETVSILKEYPSVRWVSEKDSGTLEAMWKGLKMATGEYVMSCYVTDGYLDPDWLKKCAETLDSDPEVSLVWGLPQYLSEDGTLGEISYEQFHALLPPQKENFIYYWLQTKFALPEGNLCARKKVFEACMESNLKSTENYWLELNYRFHVGGYLPYFIPIVANFGRVHSNSEGHKKGVVEFERKCADLARKKIQEYGKKLEKGLVKHQFRDGQDNILPIKFSMQKYGQVKKDLKLSFAYLIKANIKKVIPTAMKIVIQKNITKSIRD